MRFGRISARIVRFRVLSNEILGYALSVLYAGSVGFMNYKNFERQYRCICVKKYTRVFMFRSEIIRRNVKY